MDRAILTEFRAGGDGEGEAYDKRMEHDAHLEDLHKRLERLECEH